MPATPSDYRLDPGQIIIPDMSDEHRQTRQRFDAIAEEYDRHAVVQREVAARLLERLDDLKFTPATILDLGCATGQQATALRQRFPKARILALDSARRMFDRARRRRGRWRRRFELIAGDAQALPLADASVDLVVASMTLEWCHDPERALQSLRRIVRPAGLLLLATTGPDTHRELHRMLASTPGTITGGKLIHAMQLGDTLTRAGFQEPVVDTDWLTSTHDTLAALIEDLQQTGTAISPNLDIDELSRHYRSHRNQAGHYPLTWEIVYASAWAPDEGQPIRTGAGEEASISPGNIPIRTRSRT